MSNKTFAIIKPDAVKNNFTGKIYNHILENNFKILSSKLIRMTKKHAEEFYKTHEEKPFYEEFELLYRQFYKTINRRFLNFITV